MNQYTQYTRDFNETAIGSFLLSKGIGVKNLRVELLKVASQYRRELHKYVVGK